MMETTDYPIKAIPIELRELPRWACWQERPNANGKKPDKPPINANVNFTGWHSFANPDDAKTWASFDAALHYWQAHLRGNDLASGVSFALNRDGIIGIDLDNCRKAKTKTIDKWALEIIKRFGSYTEISPSGTGIRIFIRGKLPAAGHRKGKIEVYDTKKFLTVTGRVLSSQGAGDSIEDRSAELAKWHHEVFGDVPTSTKERKSNGQLVINEVPKIDSAQLEQLFRSKPKAKEIFTGLHSYKSQSQADMALANYATAAGWTAQQTCDLLVAGRANSGALPKHFGYFEQTVSKARIAPPTGIAKAHIELNRSGTDEISISGSHVDQTPEAGSMADVAKLIEGVKFLVREWLPYGMNTMLVGEPGVGKSAFALYGLVRPIITPCDWFNGMKKPAKAGNVLWCDCEGTAGITIQRIKDWGLPLERIKVPFKDDPLLSINLDCDEHLKRMEAVIGMHEIQLVVIDSLRGAHDGDENNSRVSGVVQKLAKLAERTGTAVVIIHHTRKLLDGQDVTANASRGSNAIVGLVRSQLGIDRPDSQSTWCRLQMLKENLGLKPKPIGFQITNKGLEFGDAPRRVKKETAHDLAVEFLRAKIKPGQLYKAAELFDDASQQAISKDSLHRARVELGIVTTKTKDGWLWSFTNPP